MQNPPKSQLFVRARALQYSRLRSAGHTKCNCALRAQKIYNGRKNRRIGTYSKLSLACILANIISVVGIYYWNKPP